MNGHRLVPPAEARRRCGGISHSTHYRLMAAGDFPKPIVLSRTHSGRASRIAFLEAELDAWIAAKVQANRGEAQQAQTPERRRPEQPQAEQLATYLAKPDNRGATFWFDSKDFAPGDRAAILVALGDLEDGS